MSTLSLMSTVRSWMLGQEGRPAKDTTVDINRAAKNDDPSRGDGPSPQQNKDLEGTRDLQGIGRDERPNILCVAYFSAVNLVR